MSDKKLIFNPGRSGQLKLYHSRHVNLTRRTCLGSRACVKLNKENSSLHLVEQLVGPQLPLAFTGGATHCSTGCSRTPWLPWRSRRLAV